MIELSFFRAGDECAPLRPGKNEDRPSAIILRVAKTNAIGPKWGYLNAATIQVTEGTLTPKGSANIG